MDFQIMLNKANDFLNNLPEIFKNSPKDEKVAYIIVFIGIFLCIIGIMGLIIF